MSSATSDTASTRPLALLRAVLAWLLSRKLELAIFALGVALRVSMRFSFRPEWSYDSDLHWEVVEWIARHHRVPPVEAVFQAQHPPLYYALAAVLFTHGVTREQMVWLSILFGTLRLGLIWTALELYLPGRRAARAATLALAAVLAASIHLDGMVYPEALSCMWICAALLLVPAAFQRQGSARYRLTVSMGVLLGLSMLTKISGVVVIGALGVAVGLELLLADVTWLARLKNALPWAAMLSVVVAICGWYFWRNVRDYGRPFVTSFDLNSQHWLVKPFDATPLTDRRTLGFVTNWSTAIYSWPFWPSANIEHPRFFPVAMASSFVDYWNFSFSGIDIATRSPIMAGSRPMSSHVLAAARYAMFGGTVIMLASATAWFVAFRRAIWRRNFGAVAMLLVPLFTVMAALEFAINYPIDNYGVTKGVYMQFGAAPMYLLFGLAVDWSWRRAQRWPVLALLLASLWCVATYSVYCRFRVPLLPLG